MEEELDKEKEVLPIEPINNGIKRDEEGKILPGSAPLNPTGRPVGSISVITMLRQMFTNDPEDFKKFVKDYKTNKDNQRHIVEMLDGKPKQTIAGDKENPLRIITVDKDLAEINGITSTSEDNSEGQTQI